MALRPEQMSKVSVTGSKRVIDDVIEAAYDHHSLHVTDYDDRYEGFAPGDSLEGAEEVNERLVTVRSLESILDVDDSDADGIGSLDDEALTAELETIRDQVNELNDRRDELRGSIRDRQEEIERMEPFADLGIALDLLGGYDSLEVVVGEAKADAVEDALAAAEDVSAFEVFAGGNVVAAFAAPVEGAEAGFLQDSLVGVDIALLEVPDADTSPSEYVAELERERSELESELADVESELAAVKEDAAGFLLRAEEQLTIEAQKKEAPLSFATTENAFIAEGWIPTATFPDFESTIADAVGDHADVEELKRASFTPDGDHHTEAVESDDDDADASSPDATDGSTEREAATDGGHAAQASDDPPVVQNNGKAAGPFELLVQGFGRPKYSEFDPTLLVFLTFPLMFGFMIGDIGYGVLYAAVGWYLYSNYDGAFREMGAVAMWAGGFTILFGIYYGIDVFGYHAYPWFGIESWEISKGLSPGAGEWALAWLVVSALFGLLHLNAGYILSFVSNYQQHDLKHAMYESASWLLLLNGAWLWIFSSQAGGVRPEFLRPDVTLPVVGNLAELDLAASGEKPEFLFTSIDVVTLGAVQFQGLPEIVGIVALIGAFVGFLLLAIGEPTEIAEVLSPIVNVISYARIMAVLLAKGGMALAVNLLAFGAYIDEGGEGSYHFIFTPSRLAEVQAQPETYELVFAGISTAFEPSVIGIVALVGAILVAIVGHIVVLLLGITAAGIQAVRLEYVEFFGQFYEGGGDPYSPLGYTRQYTSEE